LPGNGTRAAVPGTRRARAVGLALGPILALIAGGTLPAEHLGEHGRVVAALAVWMAAWWVTEAIPLPATALLPLIVLPASGTATATAAAAPYANTAVFLFLGGFLIATALETNGLHLRFARLVITSMGTRPDRLVAGFMGVAALLSMWISNTAAAVMLLPIALSMGGMADRIPPDAAASAGRAKLSNLPLVLMLGIAWGCSIGGIATPIGTPPNALLLGFLSTEMNVQVSFGRWMLVGLSVTAILLPCAWWLLVRVLYPVPRTPLPQLDRLALEALSGQQRMTRAQRRCLAVFGLVVAAWLARGFLPEHGLPGWLDGFRRLGDAGIALLGGVALCALPSGQAAGQRLLPWEAAQRSVPWGVLLLFGGGISLATAMQANGVADAIARLFEGTSLPWPILVLLVVALTAFLTELTSNTATANLLYPVLAAVAAGLGAPVLPLLVAACFAASLAFMLPVATPPNAIVFGSGRIRIEQMARAGFVLNLFGIATVTLVVVALARWL